MLTEAQKRALLEIAWHSLVARVTGAAMTPAQVPDMPDATGTFVTVKSRGQLRGCLGTLQCRMGLAQEVARCAADAASDDPRFAPVSSDELPELSIDVSVLGPLEIIDPHDPDAIAIGRHGLVVEEGTHRGLLLPQVATEWGWTREQFLRQTCLKAGLAADAWRHAAATIYRFDAEVFGD